MQLRWKVVEQERDRLVHRPCLDHVVVVKHEHDLPGRPRQVVEQRRKRHIDRKGRRIVHKVQQLGTNARLDPLQRGNQVPQQTRKVVVSVVQRQPGDPRRGLTTRAVPDPVGDQSGLAEASRRAEMSDNFRPGSSAASSRSINRGRATNRGRLAGTNSLVASTVVGISRLSLSWLLPAGLGVATTAPQAARGRPATSLHRRNRTARDVSTYPPFRDDATDVSR